MPHPARAAKIAGAVLLAVAVSAAVGGVVISTGGSDPSSETGQLGHPLMLGLLFLVLAAGCGVAGWLLFRGRPEGVAAATAATVAIAAVAAFRLWRFGVVGVGDALVAVLLAVLLTRARAG